MSTILSTETFISTPAHVQIDSGSFERVEDFRYLEKTVLNENSIEEENKSGLNRNAVIWCRIFCLSLLSKNMNCNLVWV